MSGGGNNTSYSHWKPNLSLDIIAGGGAANYNNVLKMANQMGGSVIHSPHPQPISLTAIPSKEHLSPSASASAISGHPPHPLSHVLASSSAAASGVSIYAPTSIPRAHHNPPNATSSLATHHQIDVYSQLGMQRLGQMYKANLMANNNNHSNNNNNNNVSNNNNNTAKATNFDGIKMESNVGNVQQLVESAIGIEAKQQIMQILEKISLLQPPERLLLYMRMPSGTSETDPLRQPQNPLGTRSEINHTINWVRSHLEHDPNVSIPKQDVYEDYVGYCAREDIKPLSTADFGKVMKQIFPSIRPRRLGTRGNSRYCYAAMRKTTKLECPLLPNLSETKSNPSKFSNNRTMSSGADDDDTEANDYDMMLSANSTASWKVIKTWAEGLLDAKFRDLSEMAEHISTNYLNGPSAAMSNSSRLLLQKKLLQRKVKGRKKKSVSTSAQETFSTGVKKRRKKKLKNSLSQANSPINHPSHPSPGIDTNFYDSAGSVSTTNETIVPEEVLHIKQEQKQLPVIPPTAHYIQEIGSPRAKTEMQSQQQQSMPINLKTNDHGNVKSENDLNVYSADLGDSMELHDYANSVCKIEVEDNSVVEEVIYCKKVRRAKGLSISISSPMEASPKSVAPPQVSPQAKPSISQLSPSSMLMRPPLYSTHMESHQPKDLSLNTTEGFDLNSSNTNTTASSAVTSSTNTLTNANKRSASAAVARSKKLRFFKHASVAGLNETKVEDIATDIIIPRERVVSICNMDKDALNDYLNEGGDSQEQEAELLQYFQPPTTSSGNSNNTASKTNAVDAVSNAIMPTSTTGAYPLLENYQLYQNAGQNTATSAAHSHNMHQPQYGEIPPRQFARKQDQINELRQYLHQNLHQQPSISQSNVDSNDPIQPSNMRGESGQLPSVDSNWKNHSEGGSNSASASLVMLSSPYQRNNQGKQVGNATAVNNESNARQRKQNIHSQQQQPPQLMRSMSASPAIQQPTHQSPNTRRKNFSFVPISPGPQSPRVFTNQPNIGVISGNIGTPLAANNLQNIQERSPFVSPRRSPAIRKPIQKDLTNCLRSLQEQSISGGSYGTAFSKPTSVRNEISASAPVSPSITPHHFQFNYSMMSSHSTGSGGSETVIANATNQQQPHQHQASCAISGMCPMILESRSQSVPLHCQSPAFNTPAGNTAYSSVCNSVAQTPVPSEFADFCDDNLLDIFGETTADQNIKLETKDIPDLMEAEINHFRDHLSRSVPSTPLPSMNAYGFNSAITNMHNNSNNNSTVNGLTMSGRSRHTIDMSRSVPTTPNALISNSNSTPFRYSPEHHRDFLINGNTVDTVKSNQFYSIAAHQHEPSSQQTSPQHQQHHQQHQQQQQQQQPQQPQIISASGQPIDELPNYSDVNDPIIDGSDLLQNL